MKKTLRLAWWSLIVMVLADCGYGQNLIVNGSFETPVVPYAQYAEPPASALSPWQTDGAMFEIWAEGLAIDGFPATFAAHGRQHLEIAGGGRSVWQTVATVTGEDYVLSFFHAPRPGVDSVLTVSINSQVIATFDELGVGLTGFAWKKFRTNFTASASSTTITFADTFIRTSISAICWGCAGTHIDDVRLERLPLRAALRVSEVELCWETVTNKLYQAQYRSALTATTWTNLGGPLPGNGGTLRIRDAAPTDEPQRFYRVMAIP